MHLGHNHWMEPPAHPIRASPESTYEARLGSQGESGYKTANRSIPLEKSQLDGLRLPLLGGGPLLFAPRRLIPRPLRRSCTIPCWP